MKKILSLLIVVLFLCAAFFVFSGFTDEIDKNDSPALVTFMTMPPMLTTLGFIVNIPDTNLKAALHIRTGVPPGDNILSTDLEALTFVLDLSDEGISNLEGIQHCKNVTILVLDRNNISSLLPDMSGLSSLEQLIIQENNLTSVQAAVATIPNLFFINMSDNPITSVNAAVAGMPGLQTLTLAECAFTSFPSEVLSPHIASLSFYGNSIGTLPDSISFMRSVLVVPSLFIMYAAMRVPMLD